jgi:tetratricopeptide (TPR) repeat protein
MASPATAPKDPSNLPPAFETPSSFLRYSRSMPWNYDLQQRKHMEMLFRALNLGTTVAFLGSGCSRNVNLPDWEGFAKEAILLAWTVVPDDPGEDSPHKRHYKEKLAEFARQLRMYKMDRDQQNTVKNGAGVTDEDLRSLLAALANKKNEGAEEKPSGDKLRFILGACKHICDWSDFKVQPGKKSHFFEFLEKRFLKGLTNEDLDNDGGVHRRLLALPLHRFMTSNYDVVLEQFLARKLGQPCEKEKFEKFLKEKAFTQADRDSEKLARFAAGMSEDSRNMVFHCHGWHRDAASMIVTEENYQKWYFSDADGAGPGFRQTMELLVGSHPILFVGFGMNDPDLLMALRTLSAIEPERKAQRSLFAILREKEAKEGDAIEHYFDQYGVHVIGYKLQKGEDPGHKLADFLEKLNKDWKTGRDSWLLKPKIHGVTPPPKGSHEYWHYELAPISGGDASGNRNETGTSRENTRLRQLDISELPASGDDTSPLLIIKPTQTQGSLASLASKVKGAPKSGCLIVLVGDGGTGKSVFATRLLRDLIDLPASPPNKCFFWSSYYADDALTGIIRANKFFGNEQKELSRLERFAECLKPPQNVLIFDGLERFLRPHKDQPGMGFAANGGVSDFLDALKELRTQEKTCQATVVLTTRLVPDLLAPKELNAEFFSVEPMTTDEAKNRGTSGGSPFSPEEWASLVTLLGGHRYGMDLAALWPKGQMRNLIHYLGNVGPQRRVERMIELTLRRIESATGNHTGASQDEGLDYDERDGRRPYQSLMKRLAVFMGPIKRKTTFECCHALAKNEWEKNKEQNQNLNKNPFPESGEMWEKLITNKLLFRVKRPQKEMDCVMHAVVREFIFHNLHEADARKLASFTQVGFTSGASMVDPGKKGATIIEQLFCDLRRKCREAYKERKKAAIPNIEEAQSLCQEAFGVLRSRMQANTVARWGSYSKYIHYLVRMGDLARAYCGMGQKLLMKRQDLIDKSEQLFWSHCDSALCANSEDLVIDKHGPLFGDELAWLYHELGLALYHEGAMIDCLAIWEQGIEVNRFLDGNQPGQYTFQGYCNLGAACIQYGRLARAREYLQMAKEISLRAGNKDRDHIPRLDGYLALVRHLRGDLLLADDEYAAAIKELKKTSNTRAECIFLRHRADLKLRLKDQDNAENFIRSSRAKAEEGHFPDLVAQARLSEGHLLRTRKKYQDAIREYKIALNTAKQYGMRGLEADVHSEMARLALDLGDTETARTRAIKSLQIANELHLGLRQTHGLVVLGKATAEAGQRALGVEYLKQARELAERQHYELRAREAEEELHRLGATGSVNAPLQ